MRILVSGGGTGGHIYPALAVATHLRDRYDAEILFLGSDDGLETEVVPAAGLKLATVKAGKLQRFVSWKTVKGVARVPLGMVQAISIVREFHPQAAFTSGGYVAVPTGLAAKINGVPLLMHQQDVPPNLSNKLIAPLASRISVAFADSVQYFPAEKTLQLGNPPRQEMLDIRTVTPEQAREQLGMQPNLPLLLVTGGSQGARHLNQVVCKALPALLQHCQVLQISGKKLYDETRDLSESILAQADEETKRRYKLVAYMSEEMPLAMQAAQMVVCRSGASTLSELALLGKPGILVPLPPAIGASPQEANAAMFGRLQAAEVIANDALTPEQLSERVVHALTTPTYVETMTKNISALGRPEATQAIAETIVEMATAKGGKIAKREVVNI
ncbi:undecaprenyldiphospho-muramoylpentapeptide beta-N- acetylglucosaminyltransferase [Ktedonobacter sp. SOSP1-52]|uniref:undecaprenyldiphospho-muramoylpentapeptide beta-N-acetylglucosaminyltransferase n=1 Tax=Ktedonobacter sp. SOSP1-52 TaxID=2778366 RepID=UPI001915DC13|nr:undecaprenyldiphospho-muramoylpentapeptide beta-N-acetylglucosaminyltransferase [Ktedonobacter sp. SOSP1-52]GHO69552.1 undecaprenyldiphospho-muramoylpentapeptide beta-N- acetylglucosaminyltransferase [Ktedonobacter sp. SOSP1-52]